MFGKKALKDELNFQRKQVLRLESEKWELARDKAQLERERNNLEHSLTGHKDAISELKKEVKRLGEENKRIDDDRYNLAKDYTKLSKRKPTKDELIVQLAELLLDEERGGELESLVKQMNAALRINKNQPVPQGDEPQWINPQP
mgnify:CR=1 FL=1